MATLGNKCVMYITPDMRNTFAPHCGEAYIVDRVSNHHQLPNCYVPATRGYIISSMYRLDLSPWALPTVNKQDTTVTASANFLKKSQKFIPTLTADKQTHVAVVKKTHSLCVQ